MASSSSSDKFIDTDVEEPLPNVIMLHAIDLEYCQPRTLFKALHCAPEDQQILEEIFSNSRATAIQLQKSEAIQLKAETFLKEAEHCYRQFGLEDDWSYRLIWPMLKLARKIKQLKKEVTIALLQNVQVGDESLLPRREADGTVINKRVDFGLAIELNDDQIEHVRQITKTDQNLSLGVNPSSSLRIRNSPLFCTVEVKVPYQVHDPSLQLGVWASAIYSRWEQVKVLSTSPPQESLLPQDFPISFGWIIEGHQWLLHVIRRLPDGSRQITVNSRSYDTRNADDIYLIIATLCELMDWGNSEFRTAFATNILNLPVTTPTPIPTAVSSLALNQYSTQFRL